MNSKELLIIGNGFDLSIGLPTMYADFFSDRYSESLISNILTHVNNEHAFSSVIENDMKKIENVNFWDVFFLLKFAEINTIDKNWSNIEEEIRLFLTIDFDDYYNSIDTKLGKKSFKRIVSLSGERQYQAKKKFVASGRAYSLLILLNRTNNLNENNLDDFLNSELVVFEAAFAKYINNKLREHNDYEEKSASLIETLVSDVRQTSVISFNYTEVKNEGLISVENVHGKANQEIIFGIDYNNLNYSSEEYKYSKTYRKLLSNVHNEKHQALPTDINTIKFYGHSLSDADYSYFQSIFDFYSIYNSDVNIEFFFNVFNEDSRKCIINNQLSAVTRLLSIYGETMSNENHGKNLIHKLLLENRIRIIEIDSNGNKVGNTLNSEKG